jgi:hypothetical protein
MVMLSVALAACDHANAVRPSWVGTAPVEPGVPGLSGTVTDGTGARLVGIPVRTAKGPFTITDAAGTFALPRWRPPANWYKTGVVFFGVDERHFIFPPRPNLGAPDTVSVDLQIAPDTPAVTEGAPADVVLTDRDFDGTTEGFACGPCKTLHIAPSATGAVDVVVDLSDARPQTLVMSLEGIDNLYEGVLLHDERLSLSGATSRTLHIREDQRGGDWSSDAYLRVGLEQWARYAPDRPALHTTIHVSVRPSAE